MSVRCIRPHEVFDRVSTIPSIATVVLPNRFTYKGSPLALEQLILCALVKWIEPNNMFEFGTFTGATARLLSDNAPSAHLFSIDLDAPTRVVDVGQDAELARISMDRSAVLLEKSERITLLRGDSRTYDYSSIPPCDFIWIDGGHDLDTVASDTANAMRLLNASAVATVAWHDYGNPLYEEPTAYIDRLSESRTVYRVAETMICFSTPLEVIA